MNEEELKSFDKLDINLNDIDDLDMGLEIISYKTRQIIQELAEAVMDLSSQLQSYKQKEDKIRELIESPIDNMSLNWQSKLILQILNEGE